MYKQVIAVRADLKLSKGKMAAQVAHASLGAYRNVDRRSANAWEQGGEKKVVVKVNDLEELMHFYNRAKSMSIPCSLVRDAGKTELEPGTATAVGMGPADEKLLDSLTGKLKLA